jgi:DNA-binding transcriptional ArsR family regulator
VDAIFKALADPTRRSLLDELFERDGQTLGALEQRLPMTRFGVMKHLKVLEQAGLVITRRRGREKLHFLNPVPIRLVHDRWVSKYAEPWASALSDLKTRIEEEAEMDTQTSSAKRPWTASPTDKVFEIYIKTTPERLWQAITDDHMRRKYSFGVGIRGDWSPGSRIEQFHPGAGIAIGEGRGCSCTASQRCGATRSGAKAPRGSPGRSNPSATHAG